MRNEINPNQQNPNQNPRDFGSKDPNKKQGQNDK